MRYPFLRGVNFSGMEFTDYPRPPLAVAADYFIRQKRMNVVRLPIRWETIQPELLGRLDAKVVGMVHEQIDRVRSLDAEAFIILDVHNYGRRQVAGKDVIVGTDPVWVSAFCNLWARLADEFVRNSRILFGLMNEPNQQPDDRLMDAINSAIAVLRGVGYQNLVLIDFNQWTGRWAWNGGSNNRELALKVRDPANNWAIDYHCYLDQKGGTTAEIQPGWMADVESFTAWCAGKKLRAFMGEFGTAGDSASLEALDQLLAHMEGRQNVWMGWAWWAAGGWQFPDARSPYRLDPYPASWTVPHEPRAVTWAEPADVPQMAVLERYLAGPAGRS
jgi:endoglucanase